MRMCLQSQGNSAKDERRVLWKRESAEEGDSVMMKGRELKEACQSVDDDALYQE